MRHIAARSAEELAAKLAIVMRGDAPSPMARPRAHLDLAVLPAAVFVRFTLEWHVPPRRRVHIEAGAIGINASGKDRPHIRERGRVVGLEDDLRVVHERAQQVSASRL
jgi:hypothetical protein